MDHTLVIPTFNRSDLLLKLLRYYKKRSPTLKILILDSSSTDNADANIINVKLFGEGLVYKAFPQTTPMSVKLRDGLKLVQTKYVSFCADDDLIFTEHINKAIIFLENHSDYVSAHGRYINFNNVNKNVRVWLEYSGPGNEAAHAGARIFQMCQSYESLFYGVFKTHNLQNIFKGVADQSSLHFQELFQSVASLITGKVYRFNEIYAARQSGPPADPDRDNWQTYYWFSSNPQDFMKHYMIYREYISDYYQTYGQQPLTEKNEFLRILDLSHSIYFSAHCPSHYFFTTIQNNFTDNYKEPFHKNSSDIIIHRIAVWERRFEKLKNYFTKSRKALIRSLNQQVWDLCINKFRCRLPWDARELANDESFHQSYIEVCLYLDNKP